jgi:hypothetical protein
MSVVLIVVAITLAYIFLHYHNGVELNVAGILSMWEAILKKW